MINEEQIYERLCNTCRDSAPRTPMQRLAARSRWALRRLLLRAADQVVPVNIDWSYNVTNQFGEWVCQVNLDQTRAGYPELSVICEDDFSVDRAPQPANAA